MCLFVNVSVNFQGVLHFARIVYFPRRATERSAQSVKTNSKIDPPNKKKPIKTNVSKIQPVLWKRYYLLSGVCFSDFFLAPSLTFLDWYTAANVVELINQICTLF